jgi:hypothetical protein
MLLKGTFLILLFAGVFQVPAEDLTEKQVLAPEEKDFWSFKAPIKPTIPQVKHKEWVRQPLDLFILAKLEGSNLAPAPEAEKRILIRRVSLDLTGLPPTPREVEEFLIDESSDAYQRLVNRLLGSRRFGERLASLWLPLARYAEDQAHQVGSDTSMFYPNAYRYRDWVVDAFNRDLPYDDFVKLQLAGDKLDRPEDLPALGFLGLGPKYYNRNRLEVQADEWEDRVDTVSRTFLGLTVACARCHDHKFDPIPAADYYSLAGVFASTKMVNKTPDGKILDGKVKAEEMPPGTLHIVEDGEVKDLNIFIRGNVERKGPVAERHFLQVLSEEQPRRFATGSGRRELAESIASRENPLTARVFVNRVWASFFGRGLVQTPSNFGHTGMAPTHPELLDDLAIRFMENRWSVKELVREFVLSATYRQSSRPLNPEADPSNALFSHMPRRRLSIEQWRDAILYASGELDWQLGKSLELDDPANLRRTLYGRISRLKLNDLLMQFDYPDANVHAEQRAVTTTAMQKLFMINSPFMIQRASALSARLEKEACEEEERVEHAYKLLFGRTASNAERSAALEFLEEAPGAELSSWEQYAQVLLASNEMLYVD